MGSKGRKRRLGSTSKVLVWILLGALATVVVFLRSISTKPLDNNSSNSLGIPKAPLYPTVAKSRITSSSSCFPCDIPLNKTLAAAALVGDEQIPRILIFTHKTNLLGLHADPQAWKFFPNVLQTIHLYARAWGQLDSSMNTTKSTTPLIWFLNNTECEVIINRVEPRLTPFFREEDRGDFKGDICRAAALYWTGGFYLDCDMQTIQPALPKRVNTTFLTVQSREGFFNSFMAAAPRSIIVRHMLDVLLHYYQLQSARKSTAGHKSMPKKQQQPLAASHMPHIEESMQQISNNPTGLIGPFSLEAALIYYLQQHHHKNDLPATSASQKGRLSKDHGEARPAFSLLDSDSTLSIKESDDEWDALDGAQDQLDFRSLPDVELLAEDHLNPANTLQRAEFPHLDYQDDGTGCCCNFVVHGSGTAYFFSRMIGAKDTCDYPPGTGPPGPLHWDQKRQLLAQAPVRYVHVV